MWGKTTDKKKPLQIQGLNSKFGGSGVRITPVLYSPNKYYKNILFN